MSTFGSTLFNAPQAGLVLGLPLQKTPLVETVAGNLLTTRDFYLWFVAINAALLAAQPALGARADRSDDTAAAVPEGTLYYETDTGLFYQSRRTDAAQPSAYWAYVLGTMDGTLAERPSDLGADDAGVLYDSTDASNFRWSGTAWVDLDPDTGTGTGTGTGGSGLGCQTANSNATLTLTAAYQDVPGATLTLAAAGTYAIFGCFYAKLIGDTYILGQLSAGGVSQAADAVLLGATNTWLTMTQQWKYVAAAWDVVKLRAIKSGSGSSLVDTPHSVIMALGPM